MVNILILTLDLEYPICKLSVGHQLTFEDTNSSLRIVNLSSEDESLQHILVVETLRHEVESPETELVTRFVLDVEVTNVNFWQVVENPFQWEPLVKVSAEHQTSITVEDFPLAIRTPVPHIARVDLLFVKEETPMEVGKPSLKVSLVDQVLRGRTELSLENLLVRNSAVVLIIRVEVAFNHAVPVRDSPKLEIVKERDHGEILDTCVEQVNELTIVRYRVGGSTQRDLSEV